MEATPENLQALATYLTQTLSEKYEVRKPAEDYLMSVEGTPNYATLLLQLADSEQVEMHIRLAASINFKNFVKRNWRVLEEHPNKVRRVDDPLPTLLLLRGVVHIFSVHQAAKSYSSCSQ